MEVPLTSEQAWFLDVIHPELWNPNLWTLTRLYKMPQEVDCPTLEGAIHDIWNAHSSLRAQFERRHDGWHQRIADRSDSVPLRSFDASTIPRDQLRTVATQIAAEVGRMVDVDSGTLARFAMVDPGGDESPYLVVAAHHLVADGISLSLLERDVEAACKLRSAGKRFKANAVPFEEYANRIQEFSRSDELEGELDHWVNLPWEDLTRIPTRFPSYHTDSVRQVCSQDIDIAAGTATRLAYEIPKILEVTEQELLLAAVAESVTSLTGRDLCIKIVHNGRAITYGSASGDSDGETTVRRHLMPPRVFNTVGWLATCGVVVLPRRGECDAATYIQQVRDAIRCIPNSGISFGLLRWIGHPDRMRRHIDEKGWGPQVHFNYFGQASQKRNNRTLQRLQLPSAEAYSTHTGAPELNVRAQFRDEGLRVSWLYDRHLHEKSLVDTFMSRCRDALSEYSAIGG
ncbi:condensation domain-containing protein [Streptomyces sp. BE147]|uniref:condensation domain-containing protein n=1 Tax=Streptomyces sp. BE147 TaxID=3002524 RepID=UPI002E7763B2|nr:condensation domain-containing protein [Streptomyces sp. BE147]MEE1742640.1 condensation domain-containing protein [Streptomyces sp. BE147]